MKKWYLSILIVGLAFAVSGGIWWSGFAERTRTFGPGKYTTIAQIRTLYQMAASTGELECQQRDARCCQLKGATNSVLRTVPNGSYVHSGEVVLEFDASKIESEIIDMRLDVNRLRLEATQVEADYKIRVNARKGEIENAKDAVHLAELNLEKYVKSEYEIQKLELESEIAKAKAEIAKRQTLKEHTLELVKKGINTTRQLDEISQRLVSSNAKLKQQQERLRGLVDFTYDFKVFELTAERSAANGRLELLIKTSATKVAILERRVETTRQNLESATRELDALIQQLEYCTVRVKSRGGVIAFCKKEHYFVQANVKMSLDEKLFYFLDNTKMQVDFTLSPLIGDDVQLGQRVSIAVHALPDKTFAGTISKLGTLSNAGRLEFEAAIDQVTRSENLRPQMTADVEVHIRSLQNVLTLPIAAVVQNPDECFVYLLDEEQFERRVVTIGAANRRFVEILDGITDGDEVLLDAYSQFRVESLSGSTERSE